jgi:DnaJ-class molecular chaperone
VPEEELVSGPEQCPTCQGRGYVKKFQDGPEWRWIECSTCLGTGRADQQGRRLTNPDPP